MNEQRKGLQRLGRVCGAGGAGWPRCGAHPLPCAPQPAADPLPDCFAPLCCSPACAYDLFLSQDFAASWKNLTEQSAGRVASFRDYDWGCKMDK